MVVVTLTFDRNVSERGYEMAGILFMQERCYRWHADTERAAI